MGDFESIYSRFKSSGLSVMDFCSSECIRPRRFYERRSKLLRKDDFIPVKVNNKGQVSFPHKEKSLLSAPPVSPSPIPQSLCEISYPNDVTVRLNSPLSPEVLQTLIFLNSNRQPIFSLNESSRYYLYLYPTDMRKSFYTLSGIVTNQMGKNVWDSDAFIFINANCTCMKIPHMEYDGLVIYHMRLEHGHFHLPVINTGESRIKVIETFWNDLVMIARGTGDNKVRRYKRNDLRGLQLQQIITYAMSYFGCLLVSQHHT